MRAFMQTTNYKKYGVDLSRAEEEDMHSYSRLRKAEEAFWRQHTHSVLTASTH